MPTGSPRADVPAGWERVLLVHAHPDDESITTGATMAALVRAGAQVTLVTCTRGERGEVIGPLSHLEGDGEALAAHRTGELAAAMRELGVTDHRFLGAGSGARFRDTGMVWAADGRAALPPDPGPDAFAAADVDAAAQHLLPVLHEVRPDVVLTYDAGGGYGHPDHEQAHRVAVRAVALAPGPVVLTIVAAGTPPGPDEVRCGGEELRAVKAAALRAHATQVVVDPAERRFALSNEVWHDLDPVERFVPVPPFPGRRARP